MRFGHAVPNPFSTSGSPKLEWHHLGCAAKVQTGQQAVPKKVITARLGQIEGALRRLDPTSLPARASVAAETWQAELWSAVGKAASLGALHEDLRRSSPLGLSFV